MMGLLLPGALGLTALALPIIIFYMLRLRRQPARVSSLLLWQRVLQDHQANAPWQKLRRNLLLLLQLLLLALLVLALARPFRAVEAKVQGNVIILLDASASMQATDVTPTRFEAAKTAARALINALKPGDTVSLIAVADLPRPLITADAGLDRSALEAALKAAQPGPAPANWPTALALASAGAASMPQSTVVILSDGAIPADLPALPAPVRWMPIGTGSNNQAIVALSTREGNAGPELFARVINFSDQPAQTRLEIRVDDQLFEARNLSLAAYPQGSRSLTFTGLPATAQTIQAALSQADDLPLDNQAQTRRAPLGGRVLLVGPGNLFLERALGLLPGLSVAQTGPDNLPAQIADFDLLIFDRTAPQTIPAGTKNMLFIGPPNSTPLFAVGDVFSNTRIIIPPAADHPALAYVDFANLHLASARAVTPPPWMRPLLTAEGGPLLLAGENNSQRLAVIAFDLLKSDLPLQVDFPILMANLTRWLLEQPALEADSTAANSANRNPLNVAESNIRPNQAQISGANANQPETATLPGRQEFWWILAALTLPVLAWEWWVYWRGGGA